MPQNYTSSSVWKIHERRLYFESGVLWNSEEPLTRKNYSTPFDFEANFDWTPTQKWMEENWHVGFYAVGLYLGFIWGGQIWMRNNRERSFQLRKWLTMWNLILAVFSILGAYRTIPEVYFIFNRKNGFYYSCCVPTFKHNNVSTFWAWLFALSKLVELGDTVFIVLRRQRLLFLHWYHHVTVLLYTWFSYAEFTAPSRWYITVNYFVHSLMYSYYAIRAMGIRIPKPIAIAITSSQLLQMIVGVSVNVQSYSAKKAGLECDVSYDNIYVGFLIYASYFLLFAKFFSDAYLTNNTKYNETKVKTKNQQNGKQSSLTQNGQITLKREKIE